MEAQAQHCIRLEKYFDFRVSVHQHLIIIIINGRGYIYTNKLTYINQYNCISIFICSIYTANSNGSSTRRPPHLLFIPHQGSDPTASLMLGKALVPAQALLQVLVLLRDHILPEPKQEGCRARKKLDLAAWGVLKSREPSTSTLAQG